MTRAEHGLRFALLFALEVIIALYGERHFVRPFLGDVLVVGLIYSAVQVVLLGPARRVLATVVAFAFLIEILQWFDIVAVLGLQNSQAASLLIGRTFSWLDFLAYLVGGALVWALERRDAESCSAAS